MQRSTIHFGATLSKHDYEEKKNGSPLEKRTDFQNYSPRKPFWLSFFSQCRPGKVFTESVAEKKLMITRKEMMITPLPEQITPPPPKNHEGGRSWVPN